MRWYWVVGSAAIVLVVVWSRRRERAESGGVHRPAGEQQSAEQIDEYLRAGRKIDAIKTYRALHGVDLKAAKDAVEARARELDHT